jgi:ketosteroid isomerase-like protein
MAPETVLAMQSPEQALRDANRRYYTAFESLDLNQMDEIWAHEDWVQCVHPGWDLLMGWEEVRESWVRIFSNTRRVKIALGAMMVHVEGDTGWVACTEKVTSAYSDGIDEALTQATNIFVKRNGAWQVVAHHASPLPAGPKATVQ